MIQALHESNLRDVLPTTLTLSSKSSQASESRDLAARHRRETRTLKNNSRPSSSVLTRDI